MINKIVGEYLSIFPGDEADLKLLQSQLKNGEKMYNRRNYTGHIVSSSLVISPNHRKILLIYHPIFERWQQPGGHWDPGEAGPWLSAKREAIEETGVKIDRQLSVADEKMPLFIESHIIPTKQPKNEPPHYHHAFWYAFIAATTDLTMTDEVIEKAAWIEKEKITDPNILKALARIDKQLKAEPIKRTIKA